VKAFDGYLLEKIDALSKVTITSRLKQANKAYIFLMALI
jgi:hypothetical protein